MTTRVQLTSGMTARAISATGCALLLALFLTAPRVASAATVTDANVAELTATAKTAADHKALAAYYQKESKEASANAKFHENMLQRWNAAPGKQSFNAMKPHCQKLIDAYQEAAESYEALAKLHTQLAKEAQK